MKKKFDRLKIVFVIIIIFVCTVGSLANTSGEKKSDTLDTLRMIYVSLSGEINLLDFKTKKSKVLYKTDSYNTVVTPSLHFNNGKLIFAINFVKKGTGQIFIFDIGGDNEEVVYSGDSIWALSLSPDEKFIAFLSDFDSKSRSCTLFILNLDTKEIRKLTSDTIKRIEYIWKISWLSDSQHVVYSDSDCYVNTINIATLKIERLIKGYDPQISPDGRTLLCIKKNIINTSIPIIYDRLSGQIDQSYISRIRTAIWSPSGEYVIFVTNDSNPFKYWDMSEYHREVILYDVKSKKSKSLFKYKGYSDISITEIDK